MLHSIGINLLINLNQIIKPLELKHITEMKKFFVPRYDFDEICAKNCDFTTFLKFLLGFPKQFPTLFVTNRFFTWFLIVKFSENYELFMNFRVFWHFGQFFMEIF